MTSRLSRSCRTALLCAALLACAGRSPARAGTDPARAIVVSADSTTADALRLGRAAMEQSLGNPRGVIESLEAMDFTLEPAFAEADRAAFLLGQAYLSLGILDRFEALARSVARWERTSDFTRWIAYERLLIESRGGAEHDPRRSEELWKADRMGRATLATGSASADALAAGLLLRDGDTAGALRMLQGTSEESRSPLALWLRAQALAAAGSDDSVLLAAVANSEPRGALDRDLVGAALLRMAARARAKNEDVRPLLERVPAPSRYSSVARHMLALETMERGDAARGAAMLDSLLAADPGYSGRREVWRALAGRALEEGRWEDANGLYERVDRDWTSNREEWRALAASGGSDSLWNAWRTQPNGTEDLRVDEAAARLLAERLADAATDLRSRPSQPIPALDTPPADGAGPWPVAPPAPGAWGEALISERNAAERAEAVERTRRDLARERAELADARRYLAAGRTRAGDEAALAAGWAARLDSLRGSLAEIDARLRGVRDEEIRRIEARTAAVVRSAERNLLWMGAMRHVHLGGDARLRALAEAAPAGYPNPDSVLAAEAALAEAVRAASRRMAAESPGRIARSYEQVWRPSLIGRAAAQADLAARSLAWSRTLGRSVDSALAAAAGSARLRALEARLAPLAREADSLAAADRRLHARLAREAVERSIAALDAEREAIEYGLGAAAYGRAVRLTSRDSVAAPLAAAVSEGASAPADSAAADETDDPDTARWRSLAIARLGDFLARHPQAATRAEVRFRLADLELVAARQRFREQMANYLRGAGADGGPRGVLPVLSHERALGLYRRILAEDPGFDHRDAVLFNAGMILADEGSPEAERFFTDLVTLHPQSAYVQESWLRLGDLRFNERRFADCVEFYAKAAAGNDATIQVIANYKMGWAHFNEDRFGDAASAFRAVLDLYASGGRNAIQVDIAGEAESYLVYSLAGAGGAEAFAAHFDRAGPRPYERRVLMALGQHFRRYGEFTKAAAADEMCLRRYPNDPEALVSAGRLVETWHRSNRPALEREARLALAPRFAPGGEWSKAQSSDSLRAAGADFARTSWKSVAFEHHRKARAGGTREDWREALALYGRLLATWPDAPDAPALELDAGEASAHLGDYRAALDHYGRAARTGADSLARPAMWQRVAVTDAWYESTRPPTKRGSATGSDSLARAVIETGDELLLRYPEDAHGADLKWRQSQLALAHGWNERAASDLGQMTSRWPDDSRTPLAATQRGDALFRMQRYGEAGAAFEGALAAARRAGRDSLARSAERAIPVCLYREAEAAVAADSTKFEKHAELFEQVAVRFPGYEHAPRALYRAGLAQVRAGRPREGVRVMESLIQRFPKSEFVRDAHLQVATLHESLGERERAAAAYAAFSDRYPADESAPAAWLKGADLLAAAGLAPRAEAARLEYIRRWPKDVETAMAILEDLARRDLDRVDTAHPVSALLDRTPRAKRAVTPPSHLAAYLRRAESRPDLASRPLLAQLRFVQAEEAQPAFASARLTQPLAKSLPVRQRLLDTLLVRYRRSVDLGVPEWTHASVFRIGQALVAFGEALESSERPADLRGDDLLAYEDVLLQQSQPFYQRGEDVWSDLLRKSSEKEKESDRWIAEAQGGLWRRLSKRFYYLPEVEFPLVAAVPPRREGKDR